MLLNGYSLRRTSCGAVWFAGEFDFECNRLLNQPMGENTKNVIAELELIRTKLMATYDRADKTGSVSVIFTKRESELANSAIAERIGFLTSNQRD